MSAPDDDTLRALAAGVYPPTEREARTMAAEVLRLRGRLYATGRARDAAADAFDVLVRRVWEAATGDTHEGPASVEVLVEAVAGLRDAARAHLAADDALTIARRTDADDVPTAEARARAARDTLAGLVGYAGEVLR